MLNKLDENVLEPSWLNCPGWTRAKVNATSTSVSYWDFLNDWRWCPFCLIHIISAVN